MKEELKKLIKDSKEQMETHEWFLEINKIELPMNYYINMGRKQICEYLLEKLEEPQEHKIPEKINWKEKESMAGDLKKDKQIEVIARRTEHLKKSINEIIDYLEVEND